MAPLGILETALYVADLDRSEAFYRRLFGFETMVADGRMRALRVPGGQVLLLFVRGGSKEGDRTGYGHIPGHDGSGQLHVAFRAGREELDLWRARLEEQGVEIEADLFPPRGRSLYFRDPDGHCVEIANAEIWPSP